MLAKLQERGEAILDQVEEVTKRVNKLLGDANQKRVADALENIAQAAASANQLTRRSTPRSRHGLNPALAAIPPLTERTRATRWAPSRRPPTMSRAWPTTLNTTVAGSTRRTARSTGWPTAPRRCRRRVDSFNAATLPRVNRVTDDTSRAVRRLGRTADSINDNPQSLLYGTGGIAAGPGEPGFAAPPAGASLKSTT